MPAKNDYGGAERDSIGGVADDSSGKPASSCGEGIYVNANLAYLHSARDYLSATSPDLRASSSQRDPIHTRAESRTVRRHPG